MLHKKEANTKTIEMVEYAEDEEDLTHMYQMTKLLMINVSVPSRGVKIEEHMRQKLLAYVHNISNKTLPL
jgi:hypothetical protein